MVRVVIVVVVEGDEDYWDLKELVYCTTMSRSPLVGVDTRLRGSLSFIDSFSDSVQLPFNFFLISGQEKTCTPFHNIHEA